MIKIIEENCKGCHICIHVCPKKVLEASEKTNRKGVKPPVAKRPDDCVTCRLCELMCPDCAIFIVDEDEDKD